MKQINKKETMIRLTAIFFVFVMLFNMIAFGLGWVSELFFWLIIISSGFVAYIFIPHQNEE